MTLSLAQLVLLQMFSPCVAMLLVRINIHQEHCANSIFQADGNRRTANWREDRHDCVACLVPPAAHLLESKVRSSVEMMFSPSLATPLSVPTHELMCLLGSTGAPTRSQQSNTDQQMSLRNRWSSSTSSRIASGSWSRCHRHSRRPALSPSPSGTAARAALIA